MSPLHRGHETDPAGPGPAGTGKENADLSLGFSGDRLGKRWAPHPMSPGPWHPIVCAHVMVGCLGVTRSITLALAHEP